METEKVPQIENLPKLTGIRARVIRMGNGSCRIECQRARRKWWRELGQHKATDREFERALADGSLVWMPRVKEEYAQIF